MSTAHPDVNIDLDAQCWSAPLSSLSQELIFKLHLGLDNNQTLNSNDVLGDWRGLAEKIGFLFERIQNFSLGPMPTIEVLKEWRRIPYFQPTVCRLVEILKEIQREDVLKNIKSMLEDDVTTYISKQQYLQDSTVSSPSQLDIDAHADEFRMMTTQDVKNGYPTFYDAFVSYQTSDLPFVKYMVRILEGPEHDLKLLVPGRDDLPGSSTCTTLYAKCIQDRCRKTVIILSPEYIADGICAFQIRFSHSISPGGWSRKLVPILHTPCPFPIILRNTSFCDYTDVNLRDWFWHRVAQAINAPHTITSAWEDLHDGASAIYTQLANNQPMVNMGNQESSSSRNAGPSFADTPASMLHSTTPPGLNSPYSSPANSLSSTSWTTPGSPLFGFETRSISGLFSRQLSDQI